MDDKIKEALDSKEIFPVGPSNNFPIQPLDFPIDPVFFKFPNQRACTAVIAMFRRKTKWGRFKIKDLEKYSKMELSSHDLNYEDYFQDRNGLYTVTNRFIIDAFCFAHQQYIVRAFSDAQNIICMDSSIAPADLPVKIINPNNLCLMVEDSKGRLSPAFIGQHFTFSSFQIGLENSGMRAESEELNHSLEIADYLIKEKLF